MKTRTFLLSILGVLSALLVAWLLLPVQRSISGQAESTDDLVAALMEEAAIPGLAVAVIKDGKLALLEGYGYADIDRAIPVSVDTPFNVASISKPVMGIILLQLVDRGLLALDTPIDEYLGWRVDNPHVDGDLISLRQLATHTSSIADYYDHTSYSANTDSPIGLHEHIRNLLHPDGEQYDAGKYFLPAAPGSQREYSNLAAAVAGQLVEAVSGRTLADYSRDALFDPLGMQQSGWLLADFDLHEIAVPYEVEQCVPFTPLCADTESPRANALIHMLFKPPFGHKHRHAYPHFGNPQYPDGGLRSSIRDLSTLALALLDRDSATGSLLSPGTRDEMLRLQLPASLSTSQRFFWRDDAAGRPGHKGSDLGVFTSFYFDPQKRDAVIILMNRGVDLAAEHAMESLSAHLWKLAGEAPTVAMTGRPRAAD